MLAPLLNETQREYLIYVILFGMFVAIVIAIVVAIEMDQRMIDKEDAQEEERKLRLVLRDDQDEHEKFFNEIEEYRRDFDDAS